MKKTYETAISNKLTKAGLSDKEAVVYAFLLEHNGAYPSVVAQETGLNRTTVYKILTALSVKGLVTEYEKRKKFFYQVADPKHLEKYADMQISQANRAKEYVRALMPVLEGVYKNANDKPVVRFFEGKEGIENIYRAHIEGNMPYEMLALSNTVHLLPQLSMGFKEYYARGKAGSGITTRAIVPHTEELETDLFTFYKDVPQKYWPKVGYLPQDEFTFDAELTLFDKNKVSIVNFKEPHFSGTIIEDKTIYDMFKLFFELVWRNQKSE